MRLKKQFIRATSFAMAAAMMLGMSLPAFAARYNLNNVSITVEGQSDGFRKVTQNSTVSTDAANDETVIYQAESEAVLSKASLI